MQRISKTIFAAVLLLVSAAAVQARELDFVETHTKTFTFRGGRVSLDNSFGRISVSGYGGSTVEAKITVRADDAELGRAIKIITSESDGISIRTEYPHTIHNHSWSVDYDVRVPATAPLVVKNRFGSIDVDGMRAGGDINNAQGSIALRNTGGRQEIENQFGSIEVMSNAGDTIIRNANGNVRATHIGGSLDIADRFGTVTVSDANRNVTIRNENGNVEVTDVDGNANVSTSFASARLSKVKGTVDVNDQNGRVEVSDAARTTVRNSFGSVDLHNIGGAVTVKNANGNVTVVDIRGPIDLDTSFATVRAERIRGTADVTNANGNVTLSGIDGSAKVRTSFGSVFVKDVDGAINVDNQNGAISVSNLGGGKCHDLVLKTNFSSIKVAVPATAGYNVTARTSFGSVTTDLPILTTRSSRENITGTINGGGCRMELETANGNVVIEKE